MLVNMQIWIAVTTVVVASLGVIITWLQYRLGKRKAIDELILQPISSSNEFYTECKKIHENFSDVRVLAKTPGLLLPSERDATDFRKDYFKTINSRLEKGKHTYHLKYLFDTDGLIGVLKKNRDKGNNSMIQEFENMLLHALTHDNLDLRTTNTDPLTGLVIGGKKKAIIGFKDAPVANITEGVIIKSSELLRIISYQYDTLFRDAKKIDANFINEIFKK